MGFTKNMKKALSLSNIYILIALLFLHIESVSAVENSQAEAEALFSRRLIEFWRDKDFNLFEKQAILFFKTYPKSIYTEKLQLMLG